MQMQEKQKQKTNFHYTSSNFLTSLSWLCLCNVGLFCCNNTPPAGSLLIGNEGLTLMSLVR